jgi:hypothetical protein
MAGTSQHRVAIATAVISAASAVAVAWVTAGGVAKDKTKTTIEESSSAIAGVAGRLEKVEAQAGALKADIASQGLGRLPVGSIVPSLLEPGEFARQAGDPAVFDPERTAWVPANGLVDITRSQLEKATGARRVPDLRGLFLRGVNAGRADTLADPDGERAPGAFQSDQLAGHAHALDQRVGANGGWKGGWGGVDDQRAVNSPGDAPMKVMPFGGNETRPRNAAVHYYVKIN